MNYQQTLIEATANTTLQDVECSEMVPNATTILIFLVVLSVISLVSTFGNLLTIIVIVINPLKNLHTPFIFFLVNLSIADLVQGVVSVPLVVYKLNEHKHGIRLTSKLVHALTCISLLSVFFSTVIISLDRYIAVADPIKYRAKLSWKRCAKISLFLWLLSIVSGLLIVFTKHQLISFLVYNYFMFVAGIIVMVVVFLRIYLVLKKHENVFKSKLNQSQACNGSTINSRYNMEKKVTLVLIIVLAIFMLTYIPGLIMLNITQFCSQCSCHVRFNAYVIRYILLVLNSAFNPFVYTVRMKDFRNSIKAVFQTKLMRRQLSFLLESNIP